MITYDKAWWGNRVLFRAYGSAFPRAMPCACLSAVIAATVSALCDTTDWHLFKNSYPLQLFFFIVGFMVIFRCAICRARWRTHPRCRRGYLRSRHRGVDYSFCCGSHQTAAAAHARGRRRSSNSNSGAACPRA